MIALFNVYYSAVGPHRQAFYVPMKHVHPWSGSCRAEVGSLIRLMVCSLEVVEVKTDKCEYHICSEYISKLKKSI